MELLCEHVSPDIAPERYLAGYVAKRRHDAAKVGAEMERGDGGVLSARLAVDLPDWVVRMLGIPPLFFDETIRVHGAVERIVIDAHNPDTDVRVHTEVAGDGASGSRVTTRVRLEPTYKGYPIPEWLVRRTVNHLFAKERARDEEFCAAT